LKELLFHLDENNQVRNYSSNNGAEKLLGQNEKLAAVNYKRFAAFLSNHLSTSESVLI